MSSNRFIIFLLIAIPIIFDGWLVLKNMRSLGVAYNVASSIKHADFNGDQRVDNIVLVENHKSSEMEFVVKVDEKEILRRPYILVDGSFRTRLATTWHNGKTRLLVFDGTIENPPYKAVLEYDGTLMREVQPTSYEITALKAMARNDEGGQSSLDLMTDLYWLIRIPLFIFYYCGLFFIVFILKQKKSQQGHAH